jgi:hypothetical protein
LKGSSLNLLNCQRGGNIHAAPDGAGYGAEIGVKAVHALGGFAVFGSGFEMIIDVNAFDNQHPALFFDFALCCGGQGAFAGRNFTRFQRAAKGAGQSTGG